MKGEVRNPYLVWVLALATCGLYGIYWMYLVLTELRDYLGRDDINPALDVILTVLTGFWGIYVTYRLGGLIAAAQKRSGIADAQDQGWKFLLLMFLCGFGYVSIQSELNRAWNT